MLSNLLSQHPNVHVLIDSMLFQKTKRAYEMFEKRCFVDRRLPDVDAPLTYLQAKYVLSIVMFWLLEIQYDMPFRDDVYGSWLPTYQQRIDPYPLLKEARTRALTLRDILDAVYFQLLGEIDPAVTCFGEKTPSNSLFCDWVAAAYPEARIILNMRSPLKNIASIRNRSVDRDLDAAIELYLRFYACLERIMDLPQVRILRHEELLADLEGTGKSLFAHVGVEPMGFRTEFKPILRKDYVGTTVTSDRDRKLGEAFDDKEKDIIRRRCEKAFRRFYPKEL
ncbi:sulfotransferase [Pseudodesulfovibrio methanolicus]|uniref:Sulfotransferase n=1 Tax=Pseudodesulfovibrio methanolicus TaxID=3126690 RepID=A0ABZ2IX86_9BACT